MKISIFIINFRGKECIYILDQGVSFSKLAKTISKFKSWGNDFWRTLLAFWPTVRGRETLWETARRVGKGIPLAQ